MSLQNCSSCSSLSDHIHRAFFWVSRACPSFMHIVRTTMAASARYTSHFWVSSWHILLHSSYYYAFLSCNLDCFLINIKVCFDHDIRRITYKARLSLLPPRKENELVSKTFIGKSPSYYYWKLSKKYNESNLACYKGRQERSVHGQKGNTSLIHLLE